MLRGLILFTLFAQGESAFPDWDICGIQCIHRGGTCQDTSTKCNGYYIPGLCCIPDNHQCCKEGFHKSGCLFHKHPYDKLRGVDRYGSGAYGAIRNGTVHKGVDVACTDGATVYAPFSGRLVKQVKPFGNKNAIDDGVQLEGSGYCIQIFFIAPDRYSGDVKIGDRIGKSLNMQKVYPGITSYIHIQMCDTSIDPTPYLKLRGKRNPLTDKPRLSPKSCGIPI